MKGLVTSGAFKAGDPRTLQAGSKGNQVIQQRWKVLRMRKEQEKEKTLGADAAEVDTAGQAVPADQLSHAERVAKMRRDYDNAHPTDLRLFCLLAFDAINLLSAPADGTTSDGYHTFDELYDYRRAYNALLFNEWAAQGKYGVHKAWKHSDGEPCFGGGWFIVVAQLPTGQVSNHYKTEHWDLFRCEERERGDDWDGHTPQIALQRLLGMLGSDTPTSEAKPAEATRRSNAP